MRKIVVAIGGGENGRINSKGIQKPYETKEIDEEIVKLTKKDHPNFLFLAHSQIPFGKEAEESYSSVMKKIYEDLGCNFRCLKISEVKNDFSKAVTDIEWADIIYEGGGATELMINFWNETGLADLLKKAYEDGKVMCGVSAGAICWFNSGYTDDPKYDNQEENRVYALNIIDAYFTPHSQKEGKLDKVRTSLKYVDKVGISLSNCTAIEIIDDEYRIIKTNPIEEKFIPFAYKTYWENGKMYEEEINNSEFKKISELLSKNISKKVR